VSTYSYADCLQKSYRVNWRIGDVLGGRHFDATRRWLPAQLSGADRIACLAPAEKLKLTQVEMGAYAHLFGYVEEFIAPTMVNLAHDVELTDRAGFEALTNFAAEEVKHMTLFREVRGGVDATLGFQLALLPDARDVARAVLGKRPAAVLLLTSAIEWLTQLHYLTCFQDDATLDPLTQHIFRSHWLEESQHARMDHLETLRAFRQLSEAEKDRAVDDLIDLVGAVDGLLQTQARLDVQNLQSCLWRQLGESERDQVYSGVLAAKRYTFIESGVTHPNFQELLGLVTTPAQRHRLQEALSSKLAPVA
jgi:P-aminobenzoate N-oxygenase AurF